jgi:hypothetical protein
MNWDAIGAIAELLGAVGVIASLVYLATQIRHGQEQMDRNTRALRAGTYQQFQQSLKEMILSQLADPELGAIVNRGLADFEKLTDDEMHRFGLWHYVVMRDLDNAHYQYRLGMFDEDRWQMSLGELRLLLESPGAVQQWKARRSVLSPEFVALVEEILGEEPEGADRAQ